MFCICYVLLRFQVCLISVVCLLLFSCGVIGQDFHSDQRLKQPSTYLSTYSSSTVQFLIKFFNFNSLSHTVVYKIYYFSLFSPQHKKHKLWTANCTILYYIILLLISFISFTSKILQIILCRSAGTVHTVLL